MSRRLVRGALLVCMAATCLLRTTPAAASEFEQLGEMTRAAYAGCEGLKEEAWFRCVWASSLAVATDALYERWQKLGSTTRPPRRDSPCMMPWLLERFALRYGTAEQKAEWQAEMKKCSRFANDEWAKWQGRAKREAKAAAEAAAREMFR